MKRAALTHLTPKGEVHMVKIGDKGKTVRFAVARAEVETTKSVIDAVKQQKVGKGDVLAIVRIAAITGVKRTSELIPLCHPIAVTGVEVDIAFKSERVLVTVRVDADDRTGAEMEAMVGASIGALAFYDMCKNLDRFMIVRDVMLLEKAGGKSGAVRRHKDARR